MHPAFDHNSRRAALLNARPDVKGLVGPQSATAWLGLGACLLQFAIAALVADRPWWAIVLCALLFGAFAVHCLNCVVHECTHSLAFESTSANRPVAVLVNMPTLVPSAMAFWHYHLLHHY